MFVVNYLYGRQFKREREVFMVYDADFAAHSHEILHKEVGACRHHRPADRGSNVTPSGSPCGRFDSPSTCHHISTTNGPRVMEYLSVSNDTTLAA